MIVVSFIGHKTTQGLLLGRPHSARMWKEARVRTVISAQHPLSLASLYSRAARTKQVAELVVSTLTTATTITLEANQATERIRTMCTCASLTTMAMGVYGTMIQGFQIVLFSHPHLRLHRPLRPRHLLHLPRHRRLRHCLLLRLRHRLLCPLPLLLPPAPRARITPRRRSHHTFLLVSTNPSGATRR